MIARVEKTAEGYVVPLTAEMARVLQVEEGCEVELQPITTTHGIRYASMEESLAAYERTLPQHENTYRALAK